MVAFRVGNMSQTAHRRRSNKWNFIAWLIPAARRPCAVLDYFFAASFGSRCLGRAWKKGSLGSGPLARQPFARSIRNIWPASVRRAKPLVRPARSELTPQRGARTDVLNPPRNLAQKFQGRLAFLSVSCRVSLARPLPHCDANTSTRKDWRENR